MNGNTKFQGNNESHLDRFRPEAEQVVSGSNWTSHPFDALVYAFANAKKFNSQIVIIVHHGKEGDVFESVGQQIAQGATEAETAKLYTCYAVLTNWTYT